MKKDWMMVRTLLVLSAIILASGLQGARLSYGNWYGLDANNTFKDALSQAADDQRPILVMCVAEPCPNCTTAWNTSMNTTTLKNFAKTNEIVLYYDKQLKAPISNLPKLPNAGYFSGAAPHFALLYAYPNPDLTKPNLVTKENLLFVKKLNITEKTSAAQAVTIVSSAFPFTVDGTEIPLTPADMECECKDGAMLVFSSAANKPASTSGWLARSNGAPGKTWYQFDAVQGRRYTFYTAASTGQVACTMYDSNGKHHDTVIKTQNCDLVNGFYADATKTGRTYLCIENAAAAYELLAFESAGNPAVGTYRNPNSTGSSDGLWTNALNSLGTTSPRLYVYGSSSSPELVGLEKTVFDLQAFKTWAAGKRLVSLDTGLTSGLTAEKRAILEAYPEAKGWGALGKPSFVYERANGTLVGSFTYNEASAIFGSSLWSTPTLLTYLNQLSTLAADGNEGANNRSTTTNAVLTGGTAVNATIGGVDKVDWYRMTAGVGESWKLSFKLTDQPSNTTTARAFIGIFEDNVDFLKPVVQADGTLAGSAFCATSTLVNAYNTGLILNFKPADGKAYRICAYVTDEGNLMNYTLTPTVTKLSYTVSFSQDIFQTTCNTDTLVVPLTLTTLSGNAQDVKIQWGLFLVNDQSAQPEQSYPFVKMTGSPLNIYFSPYRWNDLVVNKSAGGKTELSFDLLHDLIASAPQDVEFDLRMRAVSNCAVTGGTTGVDSEGIAYASTHIKITNHPVIEGGPSTSMDVDTTIGGGAFTRELTIQGWDLDKVINKQACFRREYADERSKTALKPEYDAAKNLIGGIKISLVREFAAPAPGEDPVQTGLKLKLEGKIETPSPTPYKMRVILQFRDPETEECEDADTIEIDINATDNASALNPHADAQEMSGTMLAGMKVDGNDEQLVVGILNVTRGGVVMEASIVNAEHDLDAPLVLKAKSKGWDAWDPNINRALNVVLEADGDAESLELVLKDDGTGTGILTIPQPEGNPIQRNCEFSVTPDAALVANYAGYYTMNLSGDDSLVLKDGSQEEYKRVESRNPFHGRGYIGLNVDGTKTLDNVEFSGKLSNGRDIAGRGTLLSCVEGGAVIALFQGLREEGELIGAIGGRIHIDEDAATLKAQGKANVSSCSLSDGTPTIRGLVWRETEDFHLLAVCGTLYDQDAGSVCAQINGGSVSQLEFTGQSPETAFTIGEGVNAQRYEVAIGPSGVPMVESADKASFVVADGVEFPGYYPQVKSLDVDVATGEFTGRFELLASQENGMESERIEVPFQGIFTPVFADCCTFGSLAIGQGFYVVEGRSYPVFLRQADEMPIKLSAPTLAKIDGKPIAPGSDSWYFQAGSKVSLTLDIQQDNCPDANLVVVETSDETVNPVLWCTDKNKNGETIVLLVLPESLPHSRSFSVYGNYTFACDYRIESDQLDVIMHVTTDEGTIKFNGKTGVGLKRGWNLIGIPSDVWLLAESKAAFLQALKDEGGTVYQMVDNAYQAVNDVVPGGAYWIYLEREPIDDLILHGGVKDNAGNVEMGEGWQLVTSRDLDPAFANAEVYAWRNNDYRKVTAAMLKAGEAAWFYNPNN
jgi:hypothetical protein